MPESTRVKLSDKAEERLWRSIKKTGIQEFSSKIQYSASNLYNWKNKDLAIPKTVIQKANVNPEPEIVLVKAGSNAKPIKQPSLPWNIDQETFTRFKLSTYSNKAKQTVYRSKDPSLTKHFQNILSDFGDFETKTRVRSGGYELVFPWLIRATVLSVDLEHSLPAQLDEQAEVEDGELMLDGSKVENPPVSKMNSLVKKMELGANLSQQEFNQLLRIQSKPAKYLGEELSQPL